MSLLTLSRNVRMMNRAMTYQSNELMNGMLMFVFYSEPWFSILCRTLNIADTEISGVIVKQEPGEVPFHSNMGTHTGSEIVKGKVPSVGHFLFIIGFILWFVCQWP